MKKIIRIMVIVMSMIVLFSLNAIIVSADTSGDYTYTVSEGKATITKFRSSVSGKVVIPSTLGGYPVKIIGGRAFKDCTGITSVTIPEGVETISLEAFWGCSQLSSITLPSTIKLISSNAFSNTSYVLNNANYTNGQLYLGNWLIGVQATVTSCNIKAGTVGIATDAFYSKTNITSVSIPSSVKYIGPSVFQGMTKLYSITLPEGLEIIGSSAFYGCTNLGSIVIPSTVKEIQSAAFYNCKNLMSVKVLSENITYMSAGAFEGTHFVNNSYNWTGDVLYVGNWLYKARAYTAENVTIKDGTVAIADSAFSECTKLKSVKIPSSVKQIGYRTFYNCSSLESIDIPDGITELPEYVFYGCDSLTEVKIPFGVKKIGKYAFYSCDKLSNVIVPNSVSFVDEYSFEKCYYSLKVKFTGTQEEWNKIEIANNNSSFKYATKTYNYKYIDAWVSNNGKSFVITPRYIPNGNLVILALYNGDSFVKLYDEVYQGEEITFNNVTETYDKVKIMVWENYETIVPLCEVNSNPIVRN